MKNNLLVADSAKKNFVFQFTYQAVILIIPLFVSPYLTRTLGSTSLGIYTYTYSIAYYFVMFAMLGINRHGQRIIASRRNDILKLRKTFWSLYFVHLVTSFLAIVAYIAYCAFICSSDTKIAFAQTIYVTSAALDITWLFYGLEKFKIVAIRNAVIRIAECACIFLLVKSPSDVGIYTIIMCTSTCLGHAIMMPQVIHAIKPIRFGLNDIKEHLKPMITLFAAVVASSLYTMFDKTLLGLLSSKDNVAFYEYSNKIIAIPRTFITVISTVLFPRACQLASKRDYNGMKNTMDQALIVTAFIGFAACFGLVSISDLFAVLYYGENFAICGNVISCMSPLILIIGIGEAVRTQYLYPLKKDGLMVKILFTNAFVNLVLTFILIPQIGIYGAVIGSIAAETTGLILESFACRKYLDFKSIIFDIIPFAVIGFIMYVGIKLVAIYIDGTFTALIIQIGVGAIIYILIAFVYGFIFNDKLKRILFASLRSIIKRFHK